MVTFVLAVALCLAVLVLVGFVAGHNKIRSADVRVSEALSGIDVELTRRAALIPALVHTVASFAAHEKAVLDRVTDAQAALTSATGSASVVRRSTAEQQLETALGPVLALGQTHPQLTSSGNFADLQRNLADTEFLTREVASLRLAMRDTATRDFVRSELRDLLEDLLEELGKRDHSDLVADDAPTELRGG